MRVSLIGMSNIGKTYWSRRSAAAKGWRHINCDALIERKLDPELRQLGFHGLSEVAKWMGQPPDPSYAANSLIYNACEKAVMREVLDSLIRDDAPAIVDTTGSVIYTGDDILTQLRARTRIIYFEASEAHIAELYRRYLAHPKPTIWGDAYAPWPGETAEQTRARCFPDLLRERAKRYTALAHATIPFETHRNRRADIDHFIHEAGLT